MGQANSKGSVAQNKDKTPKIENTYQKEVSSSIQNNSKQSLKKEPIFFQSKEPFKLPLQTQPQTLKYELKASEPRFKTQDEKIKRNKYLEEYLKKSSVAYLAATQEPLWQKDDHSDEEVYNDSETEVDQLVPTLFDKRKMVLSGGIHPYNALGKINAVFNDPVTKQPSFYQSGTAFLITQEHIMTAAHTLFYENKRNSGKMVMADKIQFYPEPLFLKQPKVNKSSEIEHEQELLLNGIQAKVVLFDKKFTQLDHERRKPYDYAVLELDLQKGDQRTKGKALRSNFDYDFETNKERLIVIAGYPNLKEDFQNEKRKIIHNKSTKIKRSDEDIYALYYEQSAAQGFTNDKTKRQIEGDKILYYRHFTTGGTSGAPVLFLNPSGRQYEVIGVHIRKNGNLNCAVLLHSFTLKSEIKSLITNYQQKNNSYYTPTPKSAKQITAMAQRKQICPSFQLILPQQDLNSYVQAFVSNSFIFPYLFDIKFNSPECSQAFVKFVESAHLFPHLWNLSANSCCLRDPALTSLLKNALKFPSLRYIYLSNNQITGERLKALVENGHKFPSLRYINLNNNQITDQGLKALVENGHKFPSLYKIQLNNNQITGERLKALVENGHKFSSLRYIYLNNNQITGEGLKAMVENGHKFPSLQWIYLKNNQITGEGLMALIKAKKEKNNNLSTFCDLQGNNIIIQNLSNQIQRLCQDLNIMIF